MKKNEIASYIDQTLLSPTATEEEFIEFINKSKNFEFASVCINPIYIKKAKELLEGTKTKICTVIDFPLGAGGLEVKQTQADIAINDGADELDFVISLGLVKAHKWAELKAELSFIVRSVKEASMFNEKQSIILTKLILETCCLTDEEIIASCKCAKEAGFDFVKTSTGFYNSKPNGATVHAIELMRKTVGPQMGVKASGGIHNYSEAITMIQAGATRIGASCGIEIIQGAE